MFASPSSGDDAQTSSSLAPHSLVGSRDLRLRRRGLCEHVVDGSVVHFPYLLEFFGIDLHGDSVWANSCGFVDEVVSRGFVARGGMHQVERREKEHQGCLKVRRFYLVVAGSLVMRVLMYKSLTVLLIIVR